MVTQRVNMYWNTPIRLHVFCRQTRVSLVLEFSYVDSTYTEYWSVLGHFFQTPDLHLSLYMSIFCSLTLILGVFFAFPPFLFRYQTRCKTNLCVLNSSQGLTLTYLNKSALCILLHIRLASPNSWFNRLTCN